MILASMVMNLEMFDDCSDLDFDELQLDDFDQLDFEVRNFDDLDRSSLNIGTDSFDTYSLDDLYSDDLDLSDVYLGDLGDPDGDDAGALDLIDFSLHALQLIIFRAKILIQR